MERQLIVLAAALAGLYLVGKTNVVASIRRGGGFVEVADNVFAIKDALGHFVGCEDAEGNPLPREQCGDCRGGCADVEDDEDSR